MGQAHRSEKGNKEGFCEHIRSRRKMKDNRARCSVREESTGTGCPGRLWSLLLWRYSRPAWTGSCAAYCR